MRQTDDRGAGRGADTPPRRPHLRYLLVPAVVLAVVLAAVAVLVTVHHGCGGWFSHGTFTTTTGECLGPVDDRDMVQPALRPVVDKILGENAAVEKKPTPYVRIALLTPLSVAPHGVASAMSLDQVRFSLQGAYTALHRANGGEFGGESIANVQLLLVNQGSRQPFSEKLVRTVIGLGDAKHPLVAVVGLGSSFTDTELTAKAFAARGIPMVSAVTSATTLNRQLAATLHSVAPSNLDYVLALKALLNQNLPTLALHRGIIVADQNGDKDPYVGTLGEAFQQNLGAFVGSLGTLSFRGGTVKQAATPDVFGPVVTNLCTVVNDGANPVDTVFFAGRVADFRPFATALGNRPCRDKPLAVLVGATGFHEAQKYVDVLDRALVTVVYASSADAPAWAANGPDTPRGFGKFLSSYGSCGFRADTLSDGYAVMYHDALAAAVQAMRLAAQGGTDPQGAGGTPGYVIIPTAPDVDVQFGNLAQVNAVEAASGTLSFNGRDDGRPVGKVIVYRQIGTGTPFRLPPDLRPYYSK